MHSAVSAFHGMALHMAETVVVTVRLSDAGTKVGIGPLDFFEHPDKITLEMVEKWWCLGDIRNRFAVWVQGRQLWGPPLNVHNTNIS